MLLYRGKVKLLYTLIGLDWSIMGTFSIIISNIDKKNNRNLSVEYPYKMLLGEKSVDKVLSD
jgi:hypothetical protein